MKVVLANSFFTTDKNVESCPVNPIIGLAYLAAYLREQGIEVKIWDIMTDGSTTITEMENKRRFGLTPEQIQAYLEKEKPDVIGVSCIYTAHSADAHALAKIIKTTSPKYTVIFGGAHASAYSEKIIEDNNVDIVVRGEGEMTLHEIIVRMQENKPLTDIAGTTQRHNGKVVVNAPRDLIQDLDVLPFPARDLMEYEQFFEVYQKRTNYLMRDRAITMISSRGCPMDCVYCAVKTIYGRTWRGRSAKNVVDEIEYLIKMYNIGEVHFLDDSMAVNKKRLHEICDELIQRKVDIKWTTPNGIAIWQLDEPLIKKMKKAGCYRLTFGLESGNRETLKFIGKGYSLERAKELIAYCQKIGLWSLGTFIIGFPDEPMESIQETIAYALSSKLDFAVFYTATPFPGTRMHEIFQEKGLLIQQEASLFTGGCNTKYFTGQELNQLRDKAFRQFMQHRLLHFYKFITHCRTLEDIKYMIKLFKNLVMPVLMYRGTMNPSMFWRQKKTAKKRKH
jgi:radical SAM superfamily enzyme YgiQ (UPF0313 family)